eukprot:gb/GFBE01010446.1/.p1 GENE.gb/GFBE01010446.1/~~gb/GFBE01010446.1/.p1  ORF type:complete len:267 (+),score=32.88 gb/GFBE01010446.1/:1-801(+)
MHRDASDDEGACNGQDGHSKAKFDSCDLDVASEEPSALVSPRGSLLRSLGKEPSPRRFLYSNGVLPGDLKFTDGGEAPRMPRLPFASRLAASPGLYDDRGHLAASSGSSSPVGGPAESPPFASPNRLPSRLSQREDASCHASKIDLRRGMQVSPRTLLRQIAFDLEDTVSRALAAEGIAGSDSDGEDNHEPVAAIIESPRGQMCAGCIGGSAAPAWHTAGEVSASMDSPTVTALAVRDAAWLLARQREDEELLKKLAENGQSMVTL